MAVDFLPETWVADDRPRMLRRLVMRRTHLVNQRTLAGRIEAYREEWGIEPDQLHDPPQDGVQHRQWDTAVKTIDFLNRLDAMQLDHGIERGLSIDM